MTQYLPPLDLILFLAAYLGWVFPLLCFFHARECLSDAGLAFIECETDEANQAVYEREMLGFKLNLLSGLVMTLTIVCILRFRFLIY